MTPRKQLDVGCCADLLDPRRSARFAPTIARMKTGFLPISQQMWSQYRFRGSRHLTVPCARPGLPCWNDGKIEIHLTVTNQVVDVVRLT